MENNITSYEDEISLKELILILLKGKRVIAIVVAISMILAYSTSKFMMDKQYASNTILLVSNASSKPVTVDSSTSGVDQLVESLSANIPQSIATYREQMLTTDMMSRVIEDLELQDQFTPNQLKSMISVTNISDTNLLNVEVEAGDPQLAADVANALAEEYTEFVAEMNKQRLSKSSVFLQEKVQEEKAKLDAALEVYKEFIAQSPSTSEISAEINDKSSRLNSLKSELDKLETNYVKDDLQIDNSIKLKKKELAKIEALLAGTDQFIVQKQTVLKDNTATAIVQSEGESLDALLDVELENQVINSNYMLLQKKLNESKIDLQSLEQQKVNLKMTYDSTVSLYNSDIQTLSGELEELKVDYAEKSNKEKLITKDVQRAESSYDQFVQSYEDTRVAESADMGKSTILINSKAVVNEKPVGPRSALNTAIAAILGLMCSVFYVFFRHYWNESEVKIKS